MSRDFLMTHAQSRLTATLAYISAFATDCEMI